MDVTAFFSALWDDFTQMAPAAASIRASLAEQGEQVVNDHVAFRTFDRGPLSLDALEPLLLAMGYERLAPYAFPDKHLRAFGYVHPTAPRIFLSELITGEMSTDLQQIVDGLVAQIDPDLARSPAVFWHGIPWAPVAYDTYTRLLAESEYAGWLAAIGLRANHFTVSIHDLSPRFAGVEDVLQFAESKGFVANAVGGRVKGTPAVRLEQGSTMADRLAVRFAEGEHVVPTCFYEFALRHPMDNGALYPGFVADNADRIFASTHVRAA